MKYLLLLLIPVLLTAQETEDLLNVKGPMIFNNTQFYLSYSNHPEDIYYVQQYLPKNQTFNNFKQMLVFNVYVTDMTPKQALSQQIIDLDKRKENDSLLTYEIMESPDGNEFLLSFRISDLAYGQPLEKVEYCVYRYSSQVKNDKEILTIYSYINRSFGEEIEPYIANLEEIKEGFVNEMSIIKLPEFTLPDDKSSE